MERIKQAVEKAKSKQNKVNPKARTLLVSDSATSSSDNEDHEKVEYEKTKVVSLREELLEENRIVAFDKSNPKAMPFDLLRTQILQKMETNGWRTLAITSPTPGAGKSVIAINLAISIAQQTNKTALLADFDLRRPRIGTYLGIPMDKSLNDILDGSAQIHDVIVNPGIQRLVILPTKQPVTESSEALSSRKIANLIKELRERYESRIVIFDLPPVLVSDDVIVVLPQVDCVLMVVANGMSTKKEIEESLSHIPPEKLIGIVFNKAEIESTPYYYD